MDTASICLIMPYFGKWPDYFPFYLDSCRRNPDIDFLFFTDCGVPANLPANVTMIANSLDDVRSLASHKLSINACIDRPFKLCEFKAAYGDIFSDYLEGYDFWGFGDIDVVYGRIRDFATTQVLDTFDVFSARKEYVSGAFSLFRNCERVNKLYQQSPDWERVLSVPEFFSFSECNKRWNQLITGESIFDLDTDIRSFTEMVFDAERRGEIKTWFETVALEDIHSVVEVTEKGVFEFWTRYLLLHFVIVKRRTYFQVPDWDEIPSLYYITKYGFAKHGSMRGVPLLEALQLRKILRDFKQRGIRKIRRKLRWI
jgi:hypothetical protein